MRGLRVTIERSESSIATGRSASVSARSKGSALVAAVGDRSSFKNGRQFAAWLGLVPKQRSSGGRVRLCGISEDRYFAHCEDWIIYDMEDDGVCVEPWTAPPNSLNMPNARIVTPDGPLVASMTWTWR
jgi:hypothetical protein